MKTLSSRSKEVQERVEKESLSSEQVIWSPECIQSFPRLTESNLRALTLGVCQIKRLHS